MFPGGLTETNINLRSANMMEYKATYGDTCTTKLRATSCEIASLMKSDILFIYFGGEILVCMDMFSIELIGS